MHDIGFEHLHITPAEAERLSEAIWKADNVELTTIGVDIGSSTSHLMFAKLHLQRLATSLSSRFVVAGRRILWTSPIRLTPYRKNGLIDVEELDYFVRSCHSAADIAPDKVDTGAVILTGEALKRPNARAIADLFSDGTGRFVCASAGHHLEAALAARGSQAVALSRERRATLLNVDIGGGTTKLALVKDGAVVATAAIAIGGRLISCDREGAIVEISEPMKLVLDDCKLSLKLGETLGEYEAETIARKLARTLHGVLRGEPSDLARRLMVTEPLPSLSGVEAATFSGGIAEYLFGRERLRFGDIGIDLAHELQHEFGDEPLPFPLWDPGVGIRATVVGASQFTAQVSGNTIHLTDPVRLPLRNVPVVCIGFAEEAGEGAVAEACTAGLRAVDWTPDSGPAAVALRWSGPPRHDRLAAVARGLGQALGEAAGRDWPILLLLDGDVGLNLGRVIEEEFGRERAIVSIDGLQMHPFDYVDIGEPVPPTDVVPVVVKSLAF